MAVGKAVEDCHWYRYLDEFGVERFACKMADCSFKDRGYTQIGALNHSHLIKEHNVRAHKVIFGTPSTLPTPAPCQTRSASTSAKRLADRLKKGKEKLPGCATSTAPSPRAESPSQRGETLKEWIRRKTAEDRHRDQEFLADYRDSQAPINARQAFDQLKASIIKALSSLLAVSADYRRNEAPINVSGAFDKLKLCIIIAMSWLENITAENELYRQLRYPWLPKQPMRASPSRRRKSADDAQTPRQPLPSRKCPVDSTPVNRPPGKAGYKTAQACHVPVPYNSSVIHAHGASSSHGRGIITSQAGAIADVEARKARCRALAAKLHRPAAMEGVRSALHEAPGSPQMVKSRGSLRRGLPMKATSTPIAVIGEVGQSSTPALNGQGPNVDFPGSVVDDTLLGMGNDNHCANVINSPPVRYSKCDSNYLLIDANSSIKEVIEWSALDRTFTSFDIDKSSPIRPPRGSSIRRPLVLDDSPTCPPAAKESGKGALNLKWEGTGRRQTVMVRAPKIQLGGTAPPGVPASPPSVGQLIKEVAESAMAHISGGSSRSRDSIAIEDTLGQIETNTVLPPTLGWYNLDGTQISANQVSSMAVPSENSDEFVNLSTQSLERMLEELEAEIAESTDAQLVDYAPDSESEEI